MLNKFIIICLLLTTIINAQEGEIQIIENKTERKIAFYALNETDKDFDVLIEVTGSNIKQSLAKPRKIRVPATSKVLLKNIFLIRGKTPNYNYKLIVSDSLSKRALKKPFEKVVVIPKRKIPKKKIIVYLPEACESCENIIKGLEEDFYEYKTYNLEKNTNVAAQLAKAFPSSKTPINLRKNPIISIGGKLYPWIKEYSQLLKEIDRE
ncbi:hypothetical protein [Ascidiimonas sp. W6]|uniref:hypothetical protein n=1 Tax=Ascidiimonas meishanensis TaxID=3128903 RepID=UPI0030EF0271